MTAVSVNSDWGFDKVALANRTQFAFWVVIRFMFISTSTLFVIRFAYGVQGSTLWRNRRLGSGTSHSDPVTACAQVLTQACSWILQSDHPRVGYRLLLVQVGKRKTKHTKKCSCPGLRENKTKHFLSWSRCVFTRYFASKILSVRNMLARFRAI